MATVQVRYIVHDVDDAIAFYCGFLGFRMEKLLFRVFQEVEHLPFQWNTSQRPF